MFIEILKTFIESRVEFKILHYLYPLGDHPPIRLLVDWRVPYSGCYPCRQPVVFAAFTPLGGKLERAIDCLYFLKNISVS